MTTGLLSYLSHRKFTQARRRAFVSLALKALRGQNNTALLPFSDVERHLELKHARNLGLQDIELANVVGSVGRYNDFTREFLPRRWSQEGRWRQIFDLAHSFMGFPAIEVFKVGEVYFVRDGNHRVSVARASGFKTIEAYVSEYVTPIKLKMNDTLDDVLIKAGALNFFQQTKLHILRPGQTIQLTNPGRYRVLLEHIEVHRYLKTQERQASVSYEEAVCSWYDTVYLPLVKDIHARNILAKFPNRTETDLYAWLLHHRAELEKCYGLGQVDNSVILQKLEASQPNWWHKISTLLKKLTPTNRTAST